MDDLDLSRWQADQLAALRAATSAEDALDRLRQASRTAEEAAWVASLDLRALEVAMDLARTWVRDEEG